MRFSLAVLFIFTITLTRSQDNTAHWETVIYDSTTWRYFPGHSDPGNTWTNPLFDDSGWQSGKGGFGYGDNDDLTFVDANSIFIRKTFSIIDTAHITRALLNVDYDDGFVAYLNGIEIARRNMSAAFPAHSAFSQGIHEAVLHQGLPPDSFEFTAEQVEILVEGENTLAIQVHNSDPNSSDLSLRAFLSVEISNDSFHYYETPSWFPKPIQFESSNLPIMVLETHNQEIADDPEIIAELGVIDNEGERNYLTDPYNGYHGNVSVEIRGESSQMFPKKSLKIETVNTIGEDSTVTLLGMPAENDWILYAPYTDKTMLRDVLSYHLANQMGQYASRSRFCELVINGDYKGVYVLLEKIKQDKNRVDIAKLTPEDNDGDDVTGGYILRVDKIDSNDYPAWESVPVPVLSGEKNVTFQYFDPDGEDLTTEQKTYIKKFIFDFQSALTKNSFSDPQSGYKPFIDIPSFVDFILLNEVNKNVDAYIYSTYMHKDKNSNGGKLKMGPAWDFNLAFGNVDYHANSQFAPGWMYNDNYRMFWFRRLMQDPSFSDKFTCRWLELRKTILSTGYLHEWIDSTAAVLEESQARNFQRWPILGTYVWPNQFYGKTYQEEINFVKQWVAERLTWMDNNLAKTCKESVTAVEDEDHRTSVYPNPSSSAFEFRFQRTLPLSRLTIYNALGELIYSSSFSGTSFHWHGNNEQGGSIANGMYIYQVNAADGTQFKGKIVKE